jgi:sulfur-carrier protein
VTVKIVVPPFLQQMVKDTAVTVSGNTVGECINEFVKKYPGTKDMLLDEQGNLTWYFELFVNGESVYSMDPNTPVKDGDEIHMWFIIAGG